jgi:hypothetical protein
MRKSSNPSWAALIVATAALFTALGGPAWAAGLINGSRIKNGSITSNKIGRGQIKTVNLAAGAVTGAKVASGSLTATDIAPNTFLAAGGTAANAAALGGLPSSKFVQGTGNMLQHRIDVPVGTSNQFLLDLGLGEIDGSCLAGAKPEISFTTEAQPVDLTEWGTTFGSTPDINTANGMTLSTMPGNHGYTEPNPSGLPQAIDFQITQAANIVPSRVATVWTTDHSVGGTDCIFTAQALTTGV